MSLAVIQERTVMAQRTARKNTPESAGSEYATDQLQSEYFMQWVRDQMLEASQADPSEMLPLETKADARVIAKNMLNQLARDTQRAHHESKEFYEGFRKACDNSRDWLADELLTIKGEMGGGGREMRASKSVVPHLWYIDLYEGERAVRTFGPYESKKEAAHVTRSKARLGLSWGAPYQGMDMGHELRANRPKARGSVRRRA